jgi:uncharacterized protein
MTLTGASMKEQMLMAAVSIAALALSACSGKTESSTKEAADDQIYTASFDCAKAGNDIERRICSNEQLSSLDRSLADLYKNALIKQPDLVSSQRAWINERNKCTDNDCLVKSYWKRYSLLENAADEQAAAQESAEQVASSVGSQLERRKVYLYTDNPNADRTCEQDISNFSNPDEVRCVGERDWQALCNSSPFIASMAVLQLVDLNGVYFEDGKKTYEALRHLVSNGRVGGEKVVWDPDENLAAKESCLISVTVSGSYEGTDHNKYLSGYAQSFLVDGDGGVFVVSK